MTVSTAGPVRTRPFASNCYASGNERELLLECLDSNNWSVFKGATEGWDIRECGYMSSKDAAAIGPLDIRFLGGKFIRQFESEFAEMMGSTYAVSANAATSCLVMALGAINIEPGDEVIVASMSFNATATAILAYNAIPIFCEVKEDTFCLDPDDVEARITPRTKAIMVVHLGGNAADMEAVMQVAKRHGVKVIEDCAQAPGVTHRGRQVGTFGDIGVYSFTETKNITCGEGGMLVTNDRDMAFKARLIRNHGEGMVEDDWTDQEISNVIGMNFRMTEFQAAVMIPQLASLDERNRARQENTDYLRDRLAKYDNLIHPVAEAETDYVCFMLKWKWIPDVTAPSRDDLVAGLRAQGIPAGAGYGRMMHENPMFTRRIAYGTKGYPWTAYYGGNSMPQYGRGTLPRSEQINDQFIWFKFVNPPNTTDDMEDVARAFETALSRKAR